MKKIGIGALVLIVLAGSIFFLVRRTDSPEKIAQYENIVEEADLLYEGRSYTQALARYEEATKLISSRVDAYRGIVEVFLDKGRVVDAENIVINSTQKISQSDRSILFALVGNKYFDIEDYDKALEMYESATTLGVNNLIADLGKAKIYLKRNKVVDAEKIVSKSDFEGDPLYEAKLLYSYIESLTDGDKAIDILEEVTPSEDWNAKYSEFINILESIDEDELYNATKLSQVFINEGYPYLAISLLSPLEDKMIEYPDGLYFLGRALADIGSYDTALIKLEAAISAGALDPDVFRTIARIYNEKDEMENTTKYYDRAVAYAGESVEESLLTEYLNFLFENNLFTKTQDVLKIAQQYHEEVWVDMFAIKTNYALEDTEKAQYYIAEALEKEDLTTIEKKGIYYWEAKLAFDEGNLEIAKERLTSLKELDRFNPFYYLLMGEIQYQEGDFENAKDTLELAIEYDLGEGVSGNAEKALARID